MSAASRARSRLAAAVKLANFEEVAREAVVKKPAVRPAEWPRGTKPSWALFGTKEWLHEAIPVVRSAGHSVASVSVARPRGGADPIRAMVAAQDAQDKIVSELGVPFGIDAAKLASHVGVVGVLGEEEALSVTRKLAADIAKSGKYFLSAPPAAADGPTLAELLKAWE